jgi:tripartite-type tricarboxylate transporter receptor subunit TctC
VQKTSRSRDPGRGTCRHRFAPWLAAGLILVAGPALADPIADFYRGKQLTIVIRATPGGNYDSYSRLLARYLPKYIPGNPVAVPVNMPAGGGLVAFNHVMNVAPKDGTVISIITETFPMDQALGLNKNLSVDLRTINCIGNMSDSNQMLLSRQDSPTVTLEDAKQRVTVIGATGVGSTSTELVALYNNMLGTQFKIVYGYPSGAEITLAMDRGEVEGRSTGTPGSLRPPANAKPGLAPFNFLIQTGMSKLKDFPAVPLLRELAKNPDQQAVFDFFSAAIALARPVCMASRVPPDRVTAMRRAFDAALADKDLLSEAERTGLDIAPMTGEELQRLIKAMIDTPQPILEAVRQAIQVKSATPAPGVKPEKAE